MILVTGATGNAGSAVVCALVAAGMDVRALVRDPGRTAQPPAGVEAVAGDLDRPVSLATALTGVRGVFLLSGFRDMPGVLAEIRQAGVQQVVLLSSSAAPGGDMSNAVALPHPLRGGGPSDRGGDHRTTTAQLRAVGVGAPRRARRRTVRSVVMAGAPGSGGRRVPCA